MDEKNLFSYHPCPRLEFSSIFTARSFCLLSLSTRIPRGLPSYLLNHIVACVKIKTQKMYAQTLNSSKFVKVYFRYNNTDTNATDAFHLFSLSILTGKPLKEDGRGCCHPSEWFLFLTFLSHLERGNDLFPSSKLLYSPRSYPSSYSLPFRSIDKMQCNLTTYLPFPTKSKNQFVRKSIVITGSVLVVS